MPTPEERITELEKKVAELITLKLQAKWLLGIATILLAGGGYASWHELLKQAKSEAKDAVTQEVKTTAFLDLENEAKGHRDAAATAATEAKKSKEKIDDLNKQLTKIIAENPGLDLPKLKKDQEELKTTVDNLGKTSNGQGGRLSTLEVTQTSHTAQLQKLQEGKTTPNGDWEAWLSSWQLWLGIGVGALLLLIVLFLVFRRRGHGT